MKALLTCVFLCLLSGLTLPAATIFGVPVERAAKGPDHSWTTVRGLATPDSSVRHDSKKSLRVQPLAGSPEAIIRSSPISLFIGKTYKLTGWVRTENLTVRDTDRSPIASGAALPRASLPF